MTNNKKELCINNCDAKLFDIHNIMRSEASQTFSCTIKVIDNCIHDIASEEEKEEEEH